MRTTTPETGNSQRICFFHDLCDENQAAIALATNPTAPLYSRSNPDNPRESFLVQGPYSQKFEPMVRQFLSSKVPT